MANISDYLNWRGDLEFANVPFNEVDGIILAQIAYVDMTDIVPGHGEDEGITLKDASEAFFDLHDEEEVRSSKSFVGKAPFILREAAATKRFGGLVLSDYADCVDSGMEEQFAAFHIRLDGKTSYIAFRGTDDTLVGWKEDFNMSFISPVPSQTDAVNYINKTVQKLAGKLIFGGHSKGGNLAVYAAANARPSIQRRIKTVYNFDGPGFDRKFIESTEYQRVRPIIRSFVPYESVVGMLLGHDEDYEVIQSSNSGLMQHDSMSWQVMGPTFVKTGGVSERSRRLNKALDAWIEGMPYEQRAEFVDTLFQLVLSSGARNLSEISTARFKSMSAALRSFHSLDKAERSMMLRIIASLTGELGRAYQKERKAD